MSGYFVAGTDTGVGKTRVTCGLLAALKESGVRVGGMKPVAAGTIKTSTGDFNEDVVKIAEVTGQSLLDHALCCYHLPEPLSPHIAAQNSGISIQIDTISRFFADLQRRYEIIIVEGAGGWLSPISKEQTMADVAAALGLPVVLVVGLRLGCLNHALLTSQAIHSSGLGIAGWIGNQVDPDFRALAQNVDTLALRLGSPPLALLPFDDSAGSHQAALRTAAQILRHDR